jgi:hypothetical protein
VQTDPEIFSRLGFATVGGKIAIANDNLKMSYSENSENTDGNVMAGCAARRCALHVLRTAEVFPRCQQTENYFQRNRREYR